ncbi:MAG TPA: cbb3-type cytochrome c oxidase subunit II [Verrucomicrobiae bacterium]
MNSGPLLFLGLFATMAVSWIGFILTPQMQLTGLSQTNTVAVGNTLPETYPVAPSGEAHAGAEVYRANGCAACHTQMVRPSDLGSDLRQEWGVRRSVAEDYLLREPVMPGSVRIGPDLANYASRADTNDINRLYLRLYDPKQITHGTLMPPYRFLFDTRKILFFPSTNAFVPPDADAPPAGYEIIPRPEARALVAYMLSLRQNGYLYEAPPPESLRAKATNAVPTNAAPAAAKPAPAPK